MVVEDFSCNMSQMAVSNRKSTQPLVSVIVPVYKVEECLVRCLDSLCRQSLTNIEIILIDDASPDQCGDICEQYAAKDVRFKVLHHVENRGLSASRNTGVRLAKANYLMFLDSDDWVHEDFCKDAYECSKRYDADLVMFRFQRIGYPKTYTLGKRFSRRNTESNISSGYKSHLEALDLLLQDVGPGAWNKLYRKELFNSFLYPEGFYYEDVGTTHKAICHAKRIYYLNKVLYYHNYRKGSITTLRNEKVFRDWFSMSMQQYRDLAAWGYPEDRLEQKLKYIELAYCIKRIKDETDADYVFFKNSLRSLKTIPKGFSWDQKVMFLLLKYCPPAFEFVCTMLDKKIW